MMKRSLAVLIVAVCLCVLIPNLGEASYIKDLKHATTRGEMYDLLTGDAKVLWHSTLFTDKFRRSFAKKHAEIHYWTSEETENWIAKEENHQGEGWEIIISMYTRPEYRKFSLAQDTFWTSILTTSLGESVYPVKIEKLNIKPYWKVMFPYISRWDDLYRVVFPKVALGNEATLTMQSVIGQTQVTWKIK